MNFPLDLVVSDYADGTVGVSGRCDTPGQFEVLCKMFEAAQQDRDARLADQQGAAHE